MEFFLFMICAVAFFGFFGWLRSQIDKTLEHRRLMARRRAGIPEPAPEPICGCGHNFAYHDRETSACHATAQQTTKWKWDESEEEKVPTKWEAVQCPCRRYVGPEPLTTLYSPEISDTATEEPRPLKAVNEDKPVDLDKN